MAQRLTEAENQYPPVLVEPYYPSSDGKPMAESDIHARYMIDLRATLENHFADDPDVYVSGNLLLYYHQGDPDQRISPDVLVTRGIRKGLRDSYRLWVEGKAPDFVLEVTSRSTRENDTGAKRGLYEVMGVGEYFLFDPRGEYLDPRLQGNRLVNGEYRRMPPSADGSFRSRVLSLDLRLREDGALRLFDPTARRWLLTPSEEARARGEAEEQARAADQRLRQEIAARQAAEAEAARVRALLERNRRE